MMDGEGFSSCKFCRAQALHVEELEEQVRQLKERLFGKAIELPEDLDLTPAHAAMVRTMLSGRICALDLLIDATRGIPNASADWPSEVLIRTQVCTLRKKLRPFGLEIETHRALGYRLTPESRARLLNWGSCSQATGKHLTSSLQVCSHTTVPTSPLPVPEASEKDAAA